MPRYCSASAAARSPSDALARADRRHLEPERSRRRPRPGTGRGGDADREVGSGRELAQPVVEVQAQTGDADGAPGDDRRLQHDEVAGASERYERVRPARVRARRRSSAR